MIDRRSKVLHGAKAEGAMTDQFDLVVYPFQRAVGDSQPGPSQDALE
jgi:hypothetical protein